MKSPKKKWNLINTHSSTADFKRSSNIWEFVALTRIKSITYTHYNKCLWSYHNPSKCQMGPAKIISSFCEHKWPSLNKCSDLLLPQFHETSEQGAYVPRRPSLCVYICQWILIFSIKKWHISTLICAENLFF